MKLTVQNLVNSIFSEYGLISKNGYLENGYLEGLFTLNIRGTDISNNSDCFLENNLENGFVKKYVGKYYLYYKPS